MCCVQTGKIIITFNVSYVLVPRHSQIADNEMAGDSLNKQLDYHKLQ